MKVSNSKTQNKETELQEINVDSRRKIKCETCGKPLLENCELEMHIEEHDTVKKFKCKVCGKEFYLQQRYLKL
jgi:transcription elongation factor Elf1